MHYMFIALLSIPMVLGMTGCSAEDQPSNSKVEQVDLFEQPQKGQGIVEVEFTTKDKQAGKTLMEVIEASAEVIQEEGFITGINKMVADENEKEFIAIYVNGESALVGANELKLETGDVIEFKLETWE